jgi:hypothetical protein
LGVYVGSVVLFTPYLTHIRLASEVYGAYDSPFDVVWYGGLPAFWLGAALFFSLVVVRGTDVHLRRLLLMALFLFSYSAVVQMKGWPYHWHPAWALGWLCIVLALASISENARAISMVFRLPASGLTAVLLLAVMGFIASYAQRDIRFPDWPMEADLVHRLSKGLTAIHPKPRVMWLTTNAYPMFPAINYAQGRSVMRTFLFVLPGVYQNTPVPKEGPFPYHSFDEMNENEKMALEWVVEDFEKGKPDIIVVDRHKLKQGFGMTSFDFEEYFIRDSRYAALMRGYELVADGPWRFYRRKGL